MQDGKCLTHLCMHTIQLVPGMLFCQSRSSFPFMMIVLFNFYAARIQESSTVSGASGRGGEGVA